MINIKATTNIDEVISHLRSDVQRQIPYAMKETLNAVAKIAQTEVVDTMRRVFDRPTPFVLKSTYIRYASKINLSALVYIKDREIGKMRPLAETILQEFSGGTRVQKRLETWMVRAGLMSSHEYLVPAAGAEMDQYGNISRGQVQKILSQLNAGPDVTAYKSKSKRSMGKRGFTGYFWSRGGKLKRGVWARYRFAHGGAVKPVMLVVNRAIYRKLIDMDKIGNQVMQEHFNTEFNRCLDVAVRSAK
jgi:hypothetical protein